MTLLIFGHHYEIERPVTHVEEEEETWEQVCGPSVQIHLEQIQIFLQLIK